MKVRVGKIVHYKLPGTVCMAAIITYVHEDESVFKAVGPITAAASGPIVGLQIFYPLFTDPIPNEELWKVPSGNEQMYRSFPTWHFMKNCEA